MSSQGGTATAPVWRTILFRVLAVLAGGFFVAAAVPQALSPWRAVTLSNTSGVTDLNLHRWSAALAVAVFLAANVPFVGPFVALIAIPVVLVLVSYPELRALLKAPWAGGLRL